jgi:hypothetical protein
MADYSTLLRDHVTLTCRSVDRIFLQAYVPKLQTVGWVCEFLHHQRGFAIPSSAAFGKIGDAYVAEVHRWAKANGIPVRRFAKGEKKEEIARPLIEAAEREGGDGHVIGVDIRGFGRSRHALPAPSRWGYMLTGREAPERYVLRGAVCDYLRATQVGRELLGEQASRAVFQGASFAGGLARWPRPCLPCDHIPRCPGRICSL